MCVHGTTQSGAARSEGLFVHQKLIPVLQCLWNGKLLGMQQHVHTLRSALHDSFNQPWEFQVQLYSFINTSRSHLPLPAPDNICAGFNWKSSTKQHVERGGWLSACKEADCTHAAEGRSVNSSICLETECFTQLPSGRGSLQWLQSLTLPITNYVSKFTQQLAASTAHCSGPTTRYSTWEQPDSSFCNSLLPASHLPDRCSCCCIIASCRGVPERGFRMWWLVVGSG